MKIEIIKESFIFPKVCKKAAKRMDNLNDSAAELMWYLTTGKRDFENRIDFLCRVDEDYERLSSHLELYELQSSPRRGSFRKAMNAIADKFNEIDSPNLQRLKILSKEETSRIDEAYHCLRERCYWSTVVNSAVALESRLFVILERKNKATLERIRSDLRFTLGALADAYMENKGDFGKCIPDRHEHLLKLVNSFRIVSAHPKQFEIDQSTADAVFNLVLKFLLDKECEPPPQKSRGKKS